MDSCINSKDKQGGQGLELTGCKLEVERRGKGFDWKIETVSAQQTSWASSELSLDPSSIELGPGRINIQ